MKYFQAVLFFLIIYVLVASFGSLIITFLLFGKLVVYVGYSSEWYIWLPNILGILVGIFAAKTVLDPKPRKNKNISTNDR